ncbi:hypothetical protein [Streptomyces rubiginosohelvolus]|uniref:Uncharacterized protein n=1 Tax=Streptomyces rubiginosohelvolus TaxID=67362 RepID=A0ABQ3BMB8_9ACTN|nr:hypothetical protein [Streptomyces pluricolorescens]GGZ51555.1 hypothetical protein GCM10010328_27760 [Streptomyces pluricolorescens]
MFGLTTTRRLREEIDAHVVTSRRMITAWDDRDTAQKALNDEIDAHLATIRASLAAEQAAADPRPIEHPDELWSLIDWSLWGSGMGDTFRERLADTFLQAITPEDHAQALELIRWWTEDRGREPLGRRRYEDLKRRLHRALANVVRWRTEAHRARREARLLAEQLLNATSSQSTAARKVLGLPDEGPWQRAVDGLNALVDAEIPFCIEPDGRIAGLIGDERIEWDSEAGRWRLVHGDDADVTTTVDQVLTANVKADTDG